MRRMRALLSLVFAIPAGCGSVLPASGDDTQCVTGADCPTGYSCQADGSCQLVGDGGGPKTCTSDADCISGTICNAGACILEVTTVPVADPVDDQNTYTCECNCTEPSGNDDIVIDLEVCLPPDLNPNLTGLTPSEAAVKLDCASRVEDTLTDMSQQCIDNDLTCDCDAIIDNAPTTTRSFRNECNTPCVGVETDDNCDNWDPEKGVKTANKTADTEAVCLGQTTDPPNAIPDPLSQALAGRGSVCEITGGNATVEVTDEDPVTPGVHGRMTIAGDPCPGGACEVTVAYASRIDPVEFSGGLFDLGSVEVDQLTVGGASRPDAVTLDALGNGILPIGFALNSGRGHVEDPEEDQAIWGHNVRPLNVGVNWSAKTCSLSGDVLSVSDDETSLSVSIAVTGQLTNQPPTVDAGDDQMLECAGTSGNEVDLDCTSTDPDDNIVFTQWRYDGRTGDEIGGNEEVVTIHQTLGSRTYHCRAVDAGYSADEDTVDVTVEDTTPPVVTCGTPTSGTMRPSDAPLSFTATATDVCAGALTPSITNLHCEKTLKNGKVIDKGESCVVSASGATVTVTDSGGVDDHILWTAGVTDGSGNTTSVQCEVVVVNK